MSPWLFALGMAYTIGGFVWSVGVERRMRRLESAEREREDAENSTIIRRPRGIAFGSLRKFGE